MKMSNRRVWLENKVVELSYRGYTYREISQELQVSTGKISNILHKLNEAAREEIKGWIDYKTPFEYQKSLMLITYLQKQTIKLVESTKDERVQLEGVRALAELDSQKRQLLCDTFIINSAISTLQKQKKREFLVNSKSTVGDKRLETTSEQAKMLIRKALQETTEQTSNEQNQNPEENPWLFDCTIYCQVG